MAILSAVFTEAERTNWLKAWLAVDIAKSGLQQFVENRANTLHADIYKAAWSGNNSPAACIGCHTANVLKCPTKGVCKKRGAHGKCSSMHDNAAKQPRPCPANVCNKVHDEISKQHSFSTPSWKNTSAQQWAKNPWEIAKAYLPPDGYVGKTSVHDTDFNGIISFMMNCNQFNNTVSFTIAKGKHNPPCILTKAREIGRKVRHSSECKLTDLDLQDIFTILTSLLNDPTCLANDVAAQDAVRKLVELEKDTLAITTEEMIHLLETAQATLKKVENSADTSLDKMMVHLEQCRKDLNVHTDKCKKELDEHSSKWANAIDEHVGDTMESTYEQSCKELINDMKTFYNDHLSHVPISPLNDNVDEKLLDLYMPPTIFAMCKEKGAFKQKGKRVKKYKDVFKTDKRNRQIFLQGEAGSGKTTFLAKLAQDWCKSTFCHMKSSNNTDLETNDIVIYDRTMLSTSSICYEQSDLPCASSASNDDSDTSTASSVTTEHSDKYMVSSETTEESHIFYSCDSPSEDSDSSCYSEAIDSKTSTASSVTTEHSDKSMVSSETTEESDIVYSCDSSSEDSDSSCSSEAIGHTNNSSTIFADVDVLQNYMVVFYITLRHSVKRFDVYTMIKEQIIDSIYSQDDREKTYRLVNEIMKRERCLVLLDGLDEWTGPGDQHNLPTLVSVYNQTVMLITTRPWKLASATIRHSEIDELLQLDGIDKPFELSRIILSRLVDKDDLELTCSEFEHYIAKQKLDNLLSSPMMLSAIVCSYAEGIELRGSKCEIYILLLESLFKKANNEMCTFEQPPFHCFTGTDYIQPNMEHMNRLSELAFHLLFENAKENSLVFTITELKKFMIDEREQKDFALKCGILSQKRTTSTLRSASSFMFIHLSMQEFLAAYHIARSNNLVDNVISVYFNRHKDAYLDIEQVFIFLCGLNVSNAEKMSRIMHDRHALIDCVSLDFQRTILAGNRESVANGHTDISLKLSNFDFSQYTFDEHTIIDLHNIWKNNAVNALSLKFHGRKTIFGNRRISPTTDESASNLMIDLSPCRKLKTLSLKGNFIWIKDPASAATSELPIWIVLNCTDPSRSTDHSLVLASIECIHLHGVTCSYTWLCSLLQMLLRLDHNMQCSLLDCKITSGEEGLVSTSYNTGFVSMKIERQNKKTDVLIFDETNFLARLFGRNINSPSQGGSNKVCRENHTESDKLSSELEHNNLYLWKILHGLNINRISIECMRYLWEPRYTKSMSQSLASLTQLEMLCFSGNDNPALWEALRGLSIKSLTLKLPFFEEYRVNISIAFIIIPTGNT